MPPNVLCVVMDTARADAFEPYGAATGSSPTVAELARRGSAVPAAVAPSSWTMPSHASMFTGLLPRSMGLGQAPGGTRSGCRPVLEAHADRMLPEVLRAAGYATAGASANLWISKYAGFATGFQRWADVQGTRVTRMHQRDLRTRARWTLSALRAKADDGAAAAEAAIDRWLADGPVQPFFWFVNLIECHSPYLPPKPYNDLPALQRLRAAEEARRHLTLDRIWRTCAGGFDVPGEALERMRHLYRRSVLQMDDWLARVLDRLDGRRLLDDTLVIVTSDHGENFGEGGLMGHAFSLDQRLIGVPLVSAGPGALTDHAVVSLTDLPRLIAEAIGLADHPWADGDTNGAADGVAVAQFDGLSAAAGATAAASTAETIAGWGLDDAAVERITLSLAAATDGRLKIVRRSDGVEHVYDLADDPLEERPLDATAGGTHCDALDLLRRTLDRAAAAEVAPPEPAAAPAVEDVDDLEDRMRMLGYL